MSDACKLSILLIIGTLPVIIGCSSSTTPTPPAATQRVYASIANGAGPIGIFSLPLSNTSAAVGNFAGTSPFGMCVDSSHRLFVTSAVLSAGIEVFDQPIANGAVPAFSLSGFGGFTVDCAIDSAGNLYVADSSGNRIRVFKAPITSSSTVDNSINPNSAPFGVAVDPTGDLFVANLNFIAEYSPFASGNNLLATFGTVFNNWGLVIGPDGNLYVANGAANGEIDVYKSPFSNTSTPDHGLTIPGATIVYYFAFDASNNMYVSGIEGLTSTIWELAPPYTNAPVVTVIVSGSNTSGGVAVDR